MCPIDWRRYQTRICRQMMISVNKACSILRELTYPVTVSADGPDMQYQRCGVVRCKRRKS